MNKCNCRNVSCGSYDNTIILGYYPCMYEYRDNRSKAGLPSNGIQVDKCIVDQVVFLWENNIRTLGSCCGHNRTQGFINVYPEDYDKALSLGFKPYQFEDINRKDTVKTKST